MRDIRELGTVFLLIFGDKDPPQRRRRKIKNIEQEIRKELDTKTQSHEEKVGNKEY